LYVSARPGRLRAFPTRRSSDLAGWSVAIVDERPFGGTCALRGCDPKKVLRRAAEVVDAARLMNGHGIAGPAPTVDWPALMAFKRSEEHTSELQSRENLVCRLLL